MTAVDCITHTRVCPKCQQEKPLTIEFFGIKKLRHLEALRTDACRECVKARERARKKQKIIMRELRATREDRLIYNQKVREWKDKKREQDYNKIVAQNARDAFKWWFAKKSDQQVAAWYAAMGKPWLNPRLTAAQKYKLRYQLDNDFAIKQRMRLQLQKAANRDDIAQLIRKSLKNNRKLPAIHGMLGYTIRELRVHLERQFTKGMNWNKFMKGEIHIDHIHPKASFDLSDREQWRICWSLPNLRPLWAKENLAKNDKVLTLL